MVTNRVEAFSDGVFAVAITLLVFDLKVPTSRPGVLWEALRGEWPSYAGYAISFLIIGIIWVNHHAIFQQIARVDRVLLFLNLLLLMCVAVIPFPTALLARYIESGTNSHVAAVIYSGTMLWMAVSFSLIWGYATSVDGLLDERLDRAVARRTFPRFAIGVAIYVVTIGVALVSATLCLAIHGLIALYYVFDRTSGPTFALTERAEREASGDASDRRTGSSG
jgi:uncharacterized membrane protein